MLGMDEVSRFCGRLVMYRLPGPLISGVPRGVVTLTSRGLRPTGSLMIRGPVGKDPFEALASLRVVGGHSRGVMATCPVDSDGKFLLVCSWSGRMGGPVEPYGSGASTCVTMSLVNCCVRC